MLTRWLFLEGLECQCRIGAYDHERLGPQRVIINVVLELSAKSEPGRDDLEDTLNYDLDNYNCILTKFWCNFNCFCKCM